MIIPAVEQYAKAHTTEESEDLKKAITASDNELEFIDMLSGRVVGRLLAMLIKVSGAKRVLEIGTFTGVSALGMAEALPEDGRLITCEYNQRYESLARSAFAKSKAGHKITLKMGPALDTIASLSEPFDFIFLDADKLHYPQYYQAVLPLLRAGGLLVIDNVLWEGTVLEPEEEKAQAISYMNQMIAADDRVEQVMLTVRDGLTIVRKY